MDRRARAPCTPMAVEQAPNAAQMLEIAKEQIDQYLIAGIGRLFKEAEDRLIAGTNEAGSNSNQANYLDAMKEIQDIQVAVETAYLGAVGRESDAMVNPGAARDPKESLVDQELALVDTASPATTRPTDLNALLEESLDLAYPVSRGENSRGVT